MSNKKNKIRDIKPEYTKSRVNKAGYNIRHGIVTPDDIIVIENWRACHNHILNAWQATLRTRCKKIKKVVFAQRLKRKRTIFEKLVREPNMALANMQDIAGCRLIFQDLKSLNKYRTELHKAHFKHERFKAEIDPYNYIKKPALSGYRGIHDVYKFGARDNAGSAWNGLQVEIQYRTSYQHAWATAVEVAGALTGNQTKFSKQQDEDKRFFMLASEIIARVFENSKSCCHDLSNKQLIKEFESLEKKIKLLQKLENIKIVTLAQQSIKSLKKKNMILVISPTKEGPPNIGGLVVYSYDSLPDATKRYFSLEKSASPDDDIVLVRADSHDNIKQAFKNYFSDTGDFISLIKNGLKRLENLA